MFKKQLLLFSILYLYGVLYAHGHGTPTNYSYTIQSVFIYNFIKHVEWPTGNDRIVIAVLNNAKATEELNKMAKAKSTPTRALVVKDVTNEDDLLDAQVIFVPSNGSAKIAKLVEKISSKPVLVITEEADLVNKGASMSFKIVNDKLHFQINSSRIRQNSLKLSGDLEALAVK